ncbi:MAG: universal stress protein [Rubrivivax sp.]|jgi:nucleotide-binding universal stress UspA family protein|nr:universal stress protein [Rubrivivax sp.]
MGHPEPLVVVAAVDGSPASLAAVQRSLDLAARGLPVDLVLVNVQPPPTLYEVVVAHDRERLDDLRAAAGADLLAPALALARAAGLEPRHDVIGGDPADAIVEFAETTGANLLVLGQRDTDGGAATLGATARQVLERAPMPVMVVRG